MFWFVLKCRLIGQVARFSLLALVASLLSTDESEWLGLMWVATCTFCMFEINEYALMKFQAFATDKHSCSNVIAVRYNTLNAIA